MKQKQSKIIPLSDWRSVDVSLLRLGSIQIEVDRLQAELAESAAELKTKFDSKIGPLLSEQKITEKQLEAFVKEHRKDLKGKSRFLNFGVVGYRTAPPKIKFLWTVENILQALRIKRLVDCIRVKEEPNKEALELLDDETLEAVGCRRSGGREKFFCEPDLETIKDRP